MLLHILTKKGKGYEPAIAKPDKFHGLGKYKIETGETAPAADADLFRDYRQDAGKIRRHESKDRRDHRGDAERNRARIFPGTTSRLVTSMSASPKNTPRFLPAVWRRRA